MAKTKRGAVQVDEFEIPPGDQLASEHKTILAYTRELLNSTNAGESWRKPNPRSWPSGATILNGDVESQRRAALACVSQLEFLRAQDEKIAAQAENETQRINTHLLPGWDLVAERTRAVVSLLSAILSRSIPFQDVDLQKIIRWATGLSLFGSYWCPLGGIVKSLERYASSVEPSSELLAASRALGERLRESRDKTTATLATAVEQLCAVLDAKNAEGQSDEAKREASKKTSIAIERSPAGDPLILDALKRRLGVADPQVPPPTTETFGPDEFQLPANSPLKSQHAALSKLYLEISAVKTYMESNFAAFEAGKPLASLESKQFGRVLLAACERAYSATVVRTTDYQNDSAWGTRYAARGSFLSLLKHPFQLSREHFFDVLLFVSTLDLTQTLYGNLGRWDPVNQLSHLAEKAPLSQGERYVIARYRNSLIRGPYLDSPPKLIIELTRLVGDNAEFFLIPGEHWSDSANVDLGKTSGAKRQAWINLMRHFLTATSARPSAKWLTSAKELAKAIGEKQVEKAVINWLALVPKGRSEARLPQSTFDTRTGGDTIDEENALALRGILWYLSILPNDADRTRLIGNVANSAYRKVPGVGPRAVKVGNGAVYALSEIASTDAVGQLAMLKARVKFGTAQKEIEKAFNTAAEKAGLPRDEIEELAVPTYGLEDVGVRRETFGDYSAHLVVGEENSAAIQWFKTDGKPIKSVPAAVKKDHSDDIKELSQAAKDVQSMLPAQRERIDALALAQKTWPIATWRERYLDHPLIGTIARRLIWRFIKEKKTADAVYADGALHDSRGKAVDWLKSADDVRVALWHPIDKSVGEVLTWREFLEKHEIRQPFKQAHREIYVLTAAERNTRTYSNRFAAHVLRQHQFNALCAARGWKNKLRLMVDDSFPPATRSLPHWGLRAEFWIEGIGDDYGRDTNESSVFLRVSTDQVRFYSVDAAQLTAHAGGGVYGPGYQQQAATPLALDQIPPLVFSEIMRDVDLFVGVASVGNDPTWQDGGPDGRFRQYWADYAFADLGESAKTRKAVLERLIPRLAIANRCTFNDKFLVVRGDLRTYKIHLGSANILMEPNDEYLCIVPARGAAKVGGDGKVFLPFEGDERLSVILSKALMLAADKQIKDGSIISQIKLKK